MDGDFFKMGKDTKVGGDEGLEQKTNIQKSQQMDSP